MKKRNISQKLNFKKNNIASLDEESVKGGIGDIPTITISLNCPTRFCQTNGCNTIILCLTQGASCSPIGCGDTLVVC